MVEGAVELGLMRRIAQLITAIINTAPESAQQIAAVEVSVSHLTDHISCLTRLHVCEQLRGDIHCRKSLLLHWCDVQMFSSLV
jgi:hypothetical protein